MATRRTKTSSRRLETRAHASRTFKKVTRQWQLSQNIKCQEVFATPGPACANGGKIVVFSQAELMGSVGFPANANYPDAVRIRRIEADLYFKPEWIPAPLPGADQCYFAAFDNEVTNYMRIGLAKLPTVQGLSGVPPAPNPLENGATTHELSDWVDTRWLWMREHVWDPALKLGGQATNQFSCCSVQDGYTVPGWTMTSPGFGEQATFNVPPIICEPCGDPEEPAVNLGCTFVVDTPKWWHVRLRMNRTIVLKESDDLSLYFGWERMMRPADVARLPQTNMRFFGGVKLQLES